MANPSETETSIMIEEKQVKSITYIRKSAILRNSDVKKFYRSIFDKCDCNCDGFVTTAELKEFINNHEDSDIPEDVVKKIHSRFDKNGDERLDYYEFLDLISHPSIIRHFKRIGSRYLKYIEVSSVKKVMLKRTLTNTGLYEEEMVFTRHTLGIITLSIIQVLCFYIDKVYENRTYINKPLLELLVYEPSRKYEVWRYFTHILVHKNELHLYSNVIFQIILGIPLEMVHTWRVPVIYTLGDFGGCLLHSVTTRNAGLRGGSGGIYSFYAAHVATVIMNWKEMSHPFVHFCIFLTLIIFDVILNYINYIRYGRMDTTSYVTHLGAAVFGFLLGVVILRNLKVTEDENKIWYACLLILVVLVSVLITLDIVLPIPE